MSKRELLPNGNVKRPDEFSQVCVWPATVCGEAKVEEFVKFMADELKSRVFYLEEIKTKAGNGGEGGRNDLFFAVHNEDVGKFAVPRLGYGIRWIDDCKGDFKLWPARVAEYKSWDAEEEVAETVETVETFVEEEED